MATTSVLPPYLAEYWQHNIKHEHHNNNSREKAPNSSRVEAHNTPRVYSPPQIVMLTRFAGKVSSVVYIFHLHNALGFVDERRRRVKDKEATFQFL